MGTEVAAQCQTLFLPWLQPNWQCVTFCVQDSISAVLFLLRWRRAVFYAEMIWHTPRRFSYMSALRRTSLRKGTEDLCAKR